MRRELLKGNGVTKRAEQKKHRVYVVYMEKDAA